MFTHRAPRAQRWCGIARKLAVNDSHTHAHVTCACNMHMYMCMCRAAPHTRAQLGSFHERLRLPSVTDDDRRDFAKAVISMSTHGASSKPRADAHGAPANDIAREFAKYDIPLDAKVHPLPSMTQPCMCMRTTTHLIPRVRCTQLPTWFINLNREMHDLASDIVNSPEMSSTMRELRQVSVTLRSHRTTCCTPSARASTHAPQFVHLFPHPNPHALHPHLIPACTYYTRAQAHPEKAQKVSSALHYCLAQFEYMFLDAVLEYGQSIGLDARVDSLDGYLWLLGSFPSNTPIDQVRTRCACPRRAPAYNHDPNSFLCDARTGICRRNGLRAPQHRHPDDHPAVPMSWFTCALALGSDAPLAAALSPAELPLCESATHHLGCHTPQFAASPHPSTYTKSQETDQASGSASRKDGPLLDQLFRRPRRCWSKRHESQNGPPLLLDARPVQGCGGRDRLLQKHRHN